MFKFHDLMDREILIRGLAENTRKSYLGRHESSPPPSSSIQQFFERARKREGIHKTKRPLRATPRSGLFIMSISSWPG